MKHHETEQLKKNIHVFDYKLDIWKIANNYLHCPFQILWTEYYIFLKKIILPFLNTSNLIAFLTLMSYFIWLKTFKTLIWYYTMSNKFSFAVNKLSIITWTVACFLYFCLHFLPKKKKKNPVMFILLYSNIRLFILFIYDIHVHSLLHVRACVTQWVR